LRLLSYEFIAISIFTQLPIELIFTFIFISISLFSYFDYFYAYLLIFLGFFIHALFHLPFLYYFIANYLKFTHDLQNLNASLSFVFILSFSNISFCAYCHQENIYAKESLLVYKVINIHFL
jgi:hypothetical protein